MPLRGRTVFAANLDDSTFMRADFAALEMQVGRAFGMSYSTAYRGWSSMYFKHPRPLSEVFPNDTIPNEEWTRIWEKNRRRPRLHLRKTWYERINLTKVD